MYDISEENKKWVESILGKIESKIAVTSDLITTSFPYTTKEGKYESSVSELPADGYSWWTNGFWAGLMWRMYLRTKDEKYRIKAVECENQLDNAFDDYYSLHHDVGFMWLLSAVANYRITKDEKARKRGLMAADILAARYNVVAKYIKAWNTGADEGGYAIIDCMMNIPILYWASDETKDNRYRYIAENHAKSTMENHVRKDGSVNHIVIFDETTGEILDKPKGQGYAEGSSWSRGQSWALYGFILSYIHTGNEDFLDTAKRVAHYFISNVCDDYVTKCDFRSPQQPVLYDSTAGVIAACGLIEIARAVGENESRIYMDNAIKLLKATEEHFCNWSLEEQSILQMGSGSYNDAHHIPIIYGDYFLMEALMKLSGNDMLLW